MVLYSPFFPLQNAVFFPPIILTYLVPVLFTFYIQGVLKLKTIIPAPKGYTRLRHPVHNLFLHTANICLENTVTVSGLHCPASSFR